MAIWIRGPLERIPWGRRIERRYRTPVVPDRQAQIGGGPSGPRVQSSRDRRHALLGAAAATKVSSAAGIQVERGHFFICQTSDGGGLDGPSDRP